MESFRTINSISTGSEVIETRIASVKPDPGGIVIVTMKDCGYVDEFDVMDLNLAIRHTAQHRAACKPIIATADFDLS